MVNQWGRDGKFASGSAGGSRSAGGVIIPAIVALIVGAGAGYGGARVFSGVSMSDIEARDRKITELNQALSEIKFDSQGADTQQTVLRERVKELEGQIDAAKRSKEALRADADARVEQARAQAQAEVEALQKTLDEAGDLNGQLGRARKSLKVSELQIIELEKTVSEQKRQIDRLAAAADKGTAGAEKLEKDNAELTASLADARKRLTRIPALQDEISSLREQLSQKSNDADDAARKRIAALEKERDSLQVQLNRALGNAGDVDRGAKELASLRKQLDAATADLAARDAEAKNTAAGLKKANATIASQKKEIAGLDSENDGLKKAQTKLQQQVASLKAELEKLSTSPEDTGDGPSTGPDGGLTPRDHDAVVKAVEDLPGYGTLAAEKRRMLTTMLERGECVTDSLKAAYGHVSPIALRSLFRDLGGRC